VTSTGHTFFSNAREQLVSKLDICSSEPNFNPFQKAETHRHILWAQENSTRNHYAVSHLEKPQTWEVNEPASSPPHQGS
jgi:hypothetical protein